MALCSSCVYPYYPDDYGPMRRAIAATVTAVTLFVVVTGIFLFWLKRSSFLVSKRDWWSTLLCALFTVLALDTAYREYFGEAQMPCAAFFFVSYAKASLIPSALVARFLGLYAKHARQRFVLRTRSETVLASPPVAPVSSVARFVERFDAWVLRRRLDSWRQQVWIVVGWAVPWLAYYFARLATTPIYGPGYVGCRFDDVDKFILFAEAVVVLAFVARPVLALWGLPDAMLLRHEMVAQVIGWVVGVSWFVFVSDYSDLWVIHSAYGVLGACVVTFVATVWAPALLSITSRRVMPLEVLRGLVTASDDLTSTETTTVLPHRREHDTSPQKQVAESGTGGEQDASAASATASVASDTANAVNADARQAVTPIGQVAVASMEIAGTSPDIGVTVAPRLGTGDLEKLALPPVASPGYASSRAAQHSPRSVQAGSSSPRPLPAAPLASVLATRLISPPPDLTELQQILQRSPSSSILSDARALRVVGAFLVTEARGATILADALRLEFSAELLAFLNAATALHAAAATGPRAAFVSALASAVSDFVVPGAPHELNLGAGLARSLASAASDLQLNVRSQGDSDAGESSQAVLVAASLRLLGAAEREVFRLLVSGPVFRILQSPAQRAAVFSALRDVLATVIS